jgi:hypothetical protein
MTEEQRNHSTEPNPARPGCEGSEPEPSRVRRIHTDPTKGMSTGDERT